MIVVRQAITSWSVNPDAGHDSAARVPVNARVVATLRPAQPH